ncbi:MAG TPA: OmpA family protein [Chromatiales bacterium]|nr:OmpA family protein [Chromatiales bacterium]
MQKVNIMERKLIYRALFLLTIILVLTLPAGGALAQDKKVVSENLIYLQEDGRSYLLHRSMRTDWARYDFHVDKEIGLDRFFYISPKEFEWDDSSSSDTNILKFSEGDFVVIYPDHFETEVTLDDTGVFTFNSWDGKKREDGHFGFWNKPVDFTSFVYAWIVPPDFEIISYESNREGKWIKRNNTIAYYGDGVNDLTFTIKYRRKPDEKAVTGEQKPPETVTGEPAAVAVASTEPDSDGDGIVDSKDKCPDTPPATLVNAEGCQPDMDGDGIIDPMDACPDTPRGVKVNDKGCELDSDGDGVADSKDQCPGTAAGAKVDERGCEVDSDGDGVIDAKDACPGTPRGAKVGRDGCEVDTDSDGVPDSKDQCAATPAGAKVDERGCEVDSDGDGIVDSRDHCLDTPAGATVDDKGCEIDSDADGVADSMDQCPETPKGQEVGETGCPLIADADRDGVADEMDLCPQTAAGSNVDMTGCDLSKPIPLPGVKFVFGSADLTEESIGVLDNVSQILVRYPDLKLEVAGHTDSIGKAVYNKHLSQQRAETVRNYLIEKGVKADNLTAVGYGEEQPVASNRTRKGQRLNRRVELKRR